MLLEGGLNAIVGGNIGLPLSAQVDRTGDEVVHVIEASSFQLEGTVTFHPNVAVFLNFSPDHLDRHASVEDYAEAKGRIFANQTADDRAVVNAEDDRVMAFASRGRARLVPFGLNRTVTGGVCVANDTVVWRDVSGTSLPLVALSSVRLLGRHLLEDVLAASAVAHLFDVAPNAIARAVEGFGGLEHALEPVAVISGRRFVNDSKATNVEAARRAIESFGPGLAVIMGGRFKGGDLAALREPLRAREATVIAIGEARERLREAFGGVVPIEEAGTMAEAVRAAYEAARPGGTVLLAPACASFDMFRDYAERGQVFKEEVARLASGLRERARAREA
jgi:UDP-N-acetylmuramoylalanine--D-glutamate ligase